MTADNMTDRDHWHDHIDERFDKIETRLDELAANKQDKLPRGLIVGVTTTVVLQVILLAFMWGSQTEKIDTATADRYTGNDARRDSALVDQRFNTVEMDILDNEVTLKELRARIRVLEQAIPDN